MKARTGAVAIWGGIHAQVRPEESLEHADIVRRSEGEYVLAEPPTGSASTRTTPICTDAG